MPPTMPSGITDATISVLRNVRNSSTRIARMPKIATIPPTDAAEALLPALDLAGGHDAVAGRAASRPRRERRLGDAVGVEAGAHARRHGHAALLVTVVDHVGDDLKPRRQRRSGTSAPRRARHVHVIEDAAASGRPSRGTRITIGYSRRRPRATARLQAREPEAHGAVELDRRHAEQPGLCRSTTAQVRARERTGLRTYCVPGSSRARPHASGQRRVSESRSGPSMRSAMGASMGGPFSNSRTSIRRRDTRQLRAQRVEHAVACDSGRTRPAARTAARDSPARGTATTL